MKNVQIPLDLFLEIIDCMSDDELSKENLQVRLNLLTRLYKKLDALIAHEYYTKYKRTPPGKDREKLRKAYLELAAIPENYCSYKETPYEKM